MPRYRVNYVDHRGRVKRRFEFHCPDDAEAEAACGELDEAEAKELWCGARWVGFWPAGDGQPQA